MDKLLTGRRLLVVGTDLMATMLIEDILADLGCEWVSTAATIGGAFALVRANAFHAAILDANLEGAGHAVAAELTRRGVPFLISTADRDPQAAFALNPLVLRRPGGARALARALGELLAHSG